MGSRGLSRELAAIILINTFLLGGCGDDATTEPEIGALRVTLNMTGGAPDADGCRVALDGGTSQTLLDQESFTFDGLAAGPHTVTISDVAQNCTVEGGTSRSVDVSVDDTTLVAFNLACPGSGQIEVRTVTAGSAVDPDGYEVALDGEAGQAIGVSGTLPLLGVTEGEHEVLISGLADNCTVTGSNPASVTVAAGEVIELEFGVVCPPFYDHIAYTSFRDGSADIFVMRADGANSVNLTPDSLFSDWYPAWSPDGLQVAFPRTRLDAAGNRSGVSDVYVLHTVGFSVRRLTQDANVGLCTWSPDGTRIAYDSFTGAPDGDAWGDIYVVNADGSNPVNLTPGPDTGFDPAWSPDGSRIAFASERGGGLDIWVMDADGSNPVKLTDVQEPQTSVREPAYEPAWSPDGSRIAFVGPGGFCCSIWVMDADGSNASKLTGDTHTAWRPTWSADGSRIAFYRSHSSPLNAYEIFVMEADGSNQVSLTYPYDGLWPAWSPAQP